MLLVESETDGTEINSVELRRCREISHLSFNLSPRTLVHFDMNGGLH